MVTEAHWNGKRQSAEMKTRASRHTLFWSRGEEHVKHLGGVIYAPGIQILDGTRPALSILTEMEDACPALSAGSTHGDWSRRIVDEASFFSYRWILASWPLSAERYAACRILASLMATSVST